MHDATITLADGYTVSAHEFVPACIYDEPPELLTQVIVQQPCGDVAYSGVAYYDNLLAAMRYGVQLVQAHRAGGTVAVIERDREDMVF